MFGQFSASIIERAVIGNENWSSANFWPRSSWKRRETRIEKGRKEKAMKLSSPCFWSVRITSLWPQNAWKLAEKYNPQSGKGWIWFYADSTMKFSYFCSFIRLRLKRTFKNYSTKILLNETREYLSFWNAIFQKK